MSILNVNQIQPVGSGQTVTISATNIDTGSATLTAGTFTASTNGSERVRITSDGDVGIGDISPNNNYGTNLSVHSTATDGARIKISDGTSGKGNLDGFDLISLDGAAYVMNRYNNAMYFYTNNTEKLRITSGGNVQIANGNLVFSTSGTGIDFSATADGSGTSSSELFDDYEEGTWTPTFYLNGILQSYTVNSQARYLKIGKLVYLEFWLGFGQYGQTNFPTGANTPFEIGGLPYTVNDTTYPGSLGNGRTQGGLSANFNIGANNAQRICFWGTGGNFSNWAGVGKLQANQISSNTDVVIAGSYSYYN